MSVVVVNGNRIHYERLGRGDHPIIFVHGWLGSWRYWVPVMESLAAQYRSYSLDLWGFGDSARGDEYYDVPIYVDMMVAFMAELGIEEASFIGHTLGAAIATQLAAQHPEHVSKVLAVGLPLTADAINHRLLNVAPNDLLARLFWSRQPPYPEVESGLPKIARNAIALTVQAVARLNLRDTLEDVDAPLLAVYGDRDTIIAPEQADELEDSHYSARAIVLPEAYHFPMLDQAAKFTRLVLDFMDLDRPESLRDLAIKEEWRRRTR
jgi:pimeloyl-ACP methyl ester carboxylesterase